VNSRLLLNSNGYRTKTSILSCWPGEKLKSEVLVLYPLLLRSYGGVKMTTFTVAGTLYRELTLRGTNNEELMVMLK
jgi:hypothetical protein